MLTNTASKDKRARVVVRREDQYDSRTIHFIVFHAKGYRPTNQRIRDEIARAIEEVAFEQPSPAVSSRTVFLSITVTVDDVPAKRPPGSDFPRPTGATNAAQ